MKRLAATAWSSKKVEKLREAVEKCISTCEQVGDDIIDHSL